MNEDQKNRFDALMKLVDFREARVRARQVYEFQVSIAVWAVLAGAIIGLKTRPGEIWFYVLLPSIVTWHAVFWISQITVRNRCDQNLSQFYAAHAEHMIFNRPHLPEIRPKSIYELDWSERWLRALWGTNSWSATFQICATVILAVGVYLFAGVPGTP